MPIPTIQIPNFILTLPNSFSVKLDKNNFQLWKSSFLPVGKGGHELGYVDEAKPRALEFLIKDGTTKKVINPEYKI